MKKTAISILSLILLLFVAGAIYFILTFQTFSNARLKADIENIKTQVSAKAIEINFENNQEIKQGEIIARLDTKELEEKLNKIQIDFYNSQKELKQSTDKELKEASSDLERANNDYTIYKNAYQDGSVTKKDLNNAVKNLETAKTNYMQAQNNLKKTTLKIQNTNKTLDEKLKNAKLELSYTTIISPVNGIITDKNITLGEIVEKDKVIFKIIPEKCYITADIKQYQTKKIKIGQSVLITIDNKNYKGKVKDFIYNNTLLSDNSKFAPVPVIIAFDTDSPNYCDYYNKNPKIKVKALF